MDEGIYAVQHETFGMYLTLKRISYTLRYKEAIALIKIYFELMKRIF